MLWHSMFRQESSLHRGAIEAKRDSRVANLMILRQLVTIPIYAPIPGHYSMVPRWIHVNSPIGGCGVQRLLIRMVAARIAMPRGKVLKHGSGYLVNQVKYTASAILGISL